MWKVRTEIDLHPHSPQVNYSFHCVDFDQTRAWFSTILNSPHTKLHKNPENGLAADSTSLAHGQTEGGRELPHKQCFLYLLYHT
jgi:hypothetical protein